MKSRFPFLLIPLTVIGLITSEQAATATNYKINPPNDFYSVRVVYENKLAVHGKMNLELKVLVGTLPAISIPASEQLALLKCEAVDQPKIQIVEADKKSGNENGALLTEHTYRVGIPADLEARTYYIKLLFHYPHDLKRTPVERTFPLNVGTLKPNKLKFIPEEEETDSLELGIFAHKSGVVGFKLINEYPDYAVNINRITVGSSPSWLIEEVEAVENVDVEYKVNGKEILFDPPLSLLPGQEQLPKVRFKPGRTPFTKWITGFSEKDTKLIFNISYNDSNERVITTFNPKAKVKVKPNDMILFGAMVIGVLLGTIIKCYLDDLYKKGVFTKAVAGFVFITVMVGVVFALAAWVGQIQIIAFKDVQVSYDKPVMIGLIGLVGAVAGVHYLHLLAKRFLNTPGSAPASAPASTPKGE